MCKVKKVIAVMIVILIGINLHIPIAAQPLEEKVIYLTFDDGPSPTTNRILDILDLNDVKATFFIIGCHVKGEEDIIRRIRDEGHSIGLHSYSHKCRDIYSSKDTFIKEMYMTRDELKAVTGEKYNIIRFPTGSKGHLNDDMLEILHECNFRIYDWNMSISDGINYRIPPGTLYREATFRKRKPKTIFMLMHCDTFNKNTCYALQDIIDYYKKEGYSFKAIKDDTREFYFPFNKK